ncbi:MAG: hypothetical protein R6U44_07570 [Archaeoglobaceae archaeon]
MDLIRNRQLGKENRQMVYIGDDREKGYRRAVCPYCGREVHFSRENAINPKAVISCEHFTSIFMEARDGVRNELTYDQYARFKEI